MYLLILDNASRFVTRIAGNEPITRRPEVRILGLGTGTGRYWLWSGSDAFASLLDVVEVAVVSAVDENSEESAHHS